jgi:hypothetical protein
MAMVSAVVSSFAYTEHSAWNWIRYLLPPKGESTVEPALFSGSAALAPLLTIVVVVRVVENMTGSAHTDFAKKMRTRAAIACAKTREESRVWFMDGLLAVGWMMSASSRGEPLEAR